MREKGGKREKEGETRFFFHVYLEADALENSYDDSTDDSFSMKSGHSLLLSAYQSKHRSRTRARNLSDPHASMISVIDVRAHIRGL